MVKLSVNSGRPATTPTQRPVAVDFEIRDRIKELRRVCATSLVENPKNWRRHPKVQAEALSGILKEIGYANALLTRELADGSLMLIDGHLRAHTTSDALVPVLVLDVTETEADTLLATLDPLGAMAELDAERFKALLDSVRTDDAAVQQLLRQTAGERIWQLVHPDEVVEAEVSPDRADELSEKWKTASGQLWQISSHRIICGDCREKAVINRLFGDDDSRLRMIWTDPPYGVSYAEKTAWMQRHGAQRSRRPIANDNLKPDEIARLFIDALENAIAQATPGAALYATVPAGPLLPVFIAAMEEGGFGFRHCLVWLKQSFVLGRADYHYRHEQILYGWLNNGPHFFIDDRTQDSIFEIDRPTASELHPTTKPVKLIARMIANSSRPGEIVYDPFSGSGSTIVAAHQLGRIGYGCELEPGYIAVQLEQLAMLRLKPELVRS
jgi:DNA modification methylase